MNRAALRSRIEFAAISKFLFCLQGGMQLPKIEQVSAALGQAPACSFGHTSSARISTFRPYAKRLWSCLLPPRRISREAAQEPFSSFLRALLAALCPADAASEPAEGSGLAQLGASVGGSLGDTFWEDARFPLIAHAEDALRGTARALGPSAYSGIVAEAVRAAGVPGALPGYRYGLLEARPAFHHLWGSLVYALG